MAKTSLLGSFEEIVLLAILQNADDAYAVSIRRELEQRTGSEVAMGAVYVTLDRLEDKGLVGSHVERRVGNIGRPRRYYSLLGAGLDALARTRDTRQAMWRGLTVSPSEVTDR